MANLAGGEMMGCDGAVACFTCGLWLDRVFAAIAPSQLDTQQPARPGWPAGWPQAQPWRVGDAMHRNRLGLGMPFTAVGPDCMPAWFSAPLLVPQACRLRATRTATARPSRGAPGTSRQTPPKARCTPWGTRTRRGRTISAASTSGRSSVRAASSTGAVSGDAVGKEVATN